MNKKNLCLIVIIAVFVLALFNWKTENGVTPKEIDLTNVEIACSEGEIINHSAYTISYNEKHEQANWVAYELTKEELNKVAKRKDKFIVDANVNTSSADKNDYYKSGFDRGHLAPAADMCFSQKAMEESFYFSNMSPQAPSFNRGIWKKLEEQVRKWATKYSSIYIVTGGVLTENLPVIGKNEVSVPNYFYKALLINIDDNLQTIGFVIPNKKHSGSVFDFAVSIDSVEGITNIDMFCSLPNEIEAKIESDVNLSWWK